MGSGQVTFRYKRQPLWRFRFRARERRSIWTNPQSLLSEAKSATISHISPQFGLELNLCSSCLITNKQFVGLLHADTGMLYLLHACESLAHLTSNWKFDSSLGGTE